MPATICCTNGDDITAKDIFTELSVRFPSKDVMGVLDPSLYDIRPERDFAFLEQAVQTAEAWKGFFNRTSALVLGLNGLMTWNRYTQSMAAEYWAWRAAARHGLVPAKSWDDTAARIRVSLGRVHGIDIRQFSSILEISFN